MKVCPLRVTHQTVAWIQIKMKYAILMEDASSRKGT